MTNDREKNLRIHSTQQEKDFAISTLGNYNDSMVSTFMGIDINYFTKSELIKILSMQNKKWLKSIGFDLEGP